jgi:hypothetical protein
MVPVRLATAATSPSIKLQGKHATTGHFEDGSRGDRSDPNRLDFHGNTPGRFRMAPVKRHRNQSSLE